MKSFRMFPSALHETPRRSVVRSIGAQLAAALMTVVVVPAPDSLAATATATLSAAAPDYLSGGIGEEDVRRMETAAPNYSLRVEFSAGEDNEFLADVAVSITEPQGRLVFEHVDAGPILLVKLEPGTYRVMATAPDRSPEVKTVTVGGSGVSRLDFHWARPA
jgi:hypothetical protein